MRWMCLIWVMIFNEHLYLSGVWLDANLGMDIYKEDMSWKVIGLCAQKVLCV